jgi:hypothetical protein
MCQHGARAVRTAIFDGASGDKWRSFVVWLPILGGDGQSVALETGEVFRGVDVPQYWDGKQRVGKEIGRGLGVEGWLAWDIYLFYPPDAVWSDAGPPAPDALLAQVAGAVVGAKGTLPPRGDQSLLPAEFRERADVVGEPEELAELLSQVAGRFTR